MEIFQWDKNFETGLADVDQQHQRLVKVTNDFGQLISKNRVNDSDLKKIYEELVSYTQYHFEEEEKLMLSLDLDERFFSQHELEHKSFLQDVTFLHDQMLAGRDESGNELFEFLSNWLVCHILGSDLSMSRQVRAITEGQTAAQAYQAEERSVDQSTGLLLKSLNKLFHQVSNRNKQLSELNLTLEAKVSERTRALTEANLRLGEIASTDALTGLSNRRHALQLLEALWVEATSHQSDLACIMIDADGFKQINDTCGHDAGDQVLRELAKHLRHAVRTDDIVCRLGGDEFLIICPQTDATGSLHLANLAHSKIAELTVPVSGGAWQGSISVGVAVRTAEMQRIEDLIKAADQAVYAAKNAGKNCVKSAF